ncbi:hypothetical protein [Pedobacter jeongneungensis]|uniref:hypothetical protein n=1 Tax=Pedobacter jeongneungensis TaxID=947309 RepID=UPI000469073F|nr:hypothetical protein [Pedobacter jeongneungensis]
MSVHIGLMIWKEMKQQGVTVSSLADNLAISKTKTQEIINSASLDISLLVSISEILNYNFLAYYENGQLFSNLSHEEKRKSQEEIKRLKMLISEKNKAIELKEKMIQNLSHTVSILEKGQMY